MLSRILILSLLFILVKSDVKSYAGDQILRLRLTSDREAQVVLGLDELDFWTGVGLNR